MLKTLKKASSTVSEPCGPLAPSNGAATHGPAGAGAAPPPAPSYGDAPESHSEPVEQAQALNLGQPTGLANARVGSAVLAAIDRATARLAVPAVPAAPAPSGCVMADALRRHDPEG